MIFIVNRDGTVKTQITPPLYQGSVSVETMLILAPFPQSALVGVAALTPSGGRITPSVAPNDDGAKAFLLASAGIKNGDEEYNVWVWKPSAVVTKFSGTLQVQFLFTMGEQVVTTSLCSIAIGAGVQYLNPTVGEEDATAIRSYVTAALNAALNAEKNAEESMKWAIGYKYNAVAVSPAGIIVTVDRLKFYNAIGGIDYTDNGTTITGTAKAATFKKENDVWYVSIDGSAFAETTLAAYGIVYNGSTQFTATGNITAVVSDDAQYQNNARYWARVYGEATYQKKKPDNGHDLVLQDGGIYKLNPFYIPIAGVALGGVKEEANSGVLIDDNGNVSLDKSKVATNISVTTDTTNWTITFQLLDGNENAIGNQRTIDLPVESLVMNVEYISADKDLKITPQNGEPFLVPLDDIVSGLVPESRKIAGIPLNDDITAQELGTAIGLDNKVDKTTKVAGKALSSDVSSLDIVKAFNTDSTIVGDEFITVDMNDGETALSVSLDTDYRPHVVELSGTSGTLSDDNYNKLCGATSSYTAEILLGDRFYHSTRETTGYDTYTNMDESYIRIITINTDSTSADYKKWAMVVHTIQGQITLDDVPTAQSQNAVKSGGVYTALAAKQNTLTIDDYPTFNSQNVVKSGGVYSRCELIANKQTTIPSNLPATDTAHYPTSAAVRSFVNSSITSLAAFYITSNASGDAFATKSSLLTAAHYYYNGEVYAPKQNDYAIVTRDEDKNNLTSRYSASIWKQHTDFTANNFYVCGQVNTNVESKYYWAEATTTPARYTETATVPTPSAENFNTYIKYTGAGTTADYTALAWNFQYTLNNTSFTAAQLAAIDSGITHTMVEAIPSAASSSNKLVDNNTLVETIIPYVAIQHESLPTASSAYLNDIYQYTGETNAGAGLTNGFFYRCTEVSTGNFAWVQVPYENTANKVTSISSESTNAQYPSAKAVYDTVASAAESAASTFQTIADKVTSISSVSTDTQYPSALAVYRAIQGYLPRPQTLFIESAQITSSSPLTINLTASQYFSLSNSVLSNELVRVKFDEDAGDYPELLLRAEECQNSSYLAINFVLNSVDNGGNVSEANSYTVLINKTSHVAQVHEKVLLTTDEIATSISAESTDNKTASAKAVYDYCQNFEQIQYSAMPDASPALSGKIVQWKGTGTTYTNGYFYKCEEVNGSWVWTRIDTQPETESEQIQYSAMPTEGMTDGQIIQYIGDSGGDYTNGMFYKCAVNSGVYSWSPVLTQSGAKGWVLSDTIGSETEVGGDSVTFAEFSGGQSGDNHWHITNTKVDDTLTLENNGGMIAMENLSQIVDSQNQNTPLFWCGTQAEYDAISSKNTNTMYMITEET